MKARDEAKHNSFDLEFSLSPVLAQVFQGVKNDYFVLR